MDNILTTFQWDVCQSKHDNRRALSFLEVIMVVIIVGVLAGVAVPRYASFLSMQRAEAAARKVRIDLQYAKNRARISSTAQSVNFNIIDHTYLIIGANDLDHPDLPYRVSLSTPPYRAQLVSVDFNSTTSVTFNGYGVPDNSGTIVIQVGNHVETIRIIKPDDTSLTLPGDPTIK